eukprot:24072_1
MLRKLVRSKSLPTPKYNKVTKNKEDNEETNKQHNQLTDCWCIDNHNNNEYIYCNHNTIRLKPKYKNQWISCLGSKIVTKGEYKRWIIKILPTNTNKKYTKLLRGGNKSIAKVMIGIIDVNCLIERERGNIINGPFWIKPYFGYAYGGEKGKKYHNSSIGMTYSSKYKIGDIITVE